MRRRSLALSLALVLLQLGCLGGLFLVPEPDAATGLAHPSIEGMASGGDGTLRHRPILAWIVAFGVLQLVWLGHLVRIGIDGGRRPSASTIGIVGLTVLAFVAMVWRYAAGLDAAAEPGVPSATFLLLFVFWPLQLAFVVAFVVRFDRDIWPPERDEALARIVRERASRTP